MPHCLYELIIPPHNDGIPNTFLHMFKKTFRLGSYAEILPVTTITYNKQLKHMIIKLYYCVKNPEGVVQWPHTNPTINK